MSGWQGDSVGLRSADPPFHTANEVGNEILITLRVPEGTKGRCVRVTVSRDTVEASVEGWGTWKRHLLAYPYAIHEAQGVLPICDIN